MSYPEVTRGVCPGGYDAYSDPDNGIIRHREGKAVCPHQEPTRATMFNSRVAYDRHRANELYGEAISKAHEHLEKVEEVWAAMARAGRENPTDPELPEAYQILHTGLALAEAWTTLAQAVKP